MGYRVVYAVALMIFFSSCQKVNVLKNLTNLKFDLPYSQEYTAPGLDSNIQLPSTGLSYSFPAMPVATNATESMKNLNVNENQVEKMTLKSFSQQIFNTAGGFDFADSLQVYVSAKDMPEILMAYSYDIPKNTDSLAFNCTDENLKPYMLKDTVYMRMQGHFNSIPKAATYKSNFVVSMATSLMKDE